VEKFGFGGPLVLRVCCVCWAILWYGRILGGVNLDEALIFACES